MMKDNLLKIPNTKYQIQPLKIAIDARFYGVTGIGRYLSNLITYLEQIDQENDYTIFLRKENINEYQPKNPRFKKELADYQWYTFAEQFGMLKHLYQGKFDLVHFPHLNVPLLYFKPYIVTIHDLIMGDAPDAATVQFKPYFYFKRFIYRFVAWWVSHVSKKVIVPTETVKKEVIAHAHVNPQKIIVTYEGVDNVFEKFKYQNSNTKNNEEAVLKKYKIRKPYLAYLSSFYPHKNHKLLIDALELLQLEGYLYNNESLQLVLIGKKDIFAEKISEYIKSKSLSDKIILPGMIEESGYTPDEEVAVILSRALLYVSPSLKEGFGITFFEAMSMGLPILLSDVSCMPEVALDAAEYFDPYNVSELKEKIKMVLGDEQKRNDLIHKGKERLKFFSWEKMARETLGVYIRVSKTM